MPPLVARLIGCTLAFLAAGGCSAAVWQGLAQGAAAASGTTAASREILIFGGQGHKTFLGCLNCSEFSPSSVRNENGSFGSAYSATSIFNRYGQFGSKYSATSACSAYAGDPPVLVDRAGNYYGRLTVNRSNPDTSHDSDLVAWLAAVCNR